MNKHLALAGILALLAACSSEGSSPSKKSDWGTGLNTIERKYQKPAPDTHDAALAAVKSFDLTIESDRHDEMGGEIVGHRADGHKVIVEISAIDKSNSRAAVRVEPGDARLAQMVHERMADKLGLGTATPALLGGNTDNFPYDAELGSGVDAAERAVRALGWTVTGKEVRSDWARIDARDENSNPVQFKVERVNDTAFPLKVTFTAGKGMTEDSKAMIAQMHDEFDRQIGGHVK
jgi:hypothetical protein